MCSMGIIGCRVFEADSYDTNDVNLMRSPEPWPVFSGGPNQLWRGTLVGSITGMWWWWFQKAKLLINPSAEVNSQRSSLAWEEYKIHSYSMHQHERAGIFPDTSESEKSWRELEQQCDTLASYSGCFHSSSKCERNAWRISYFWPVSAFSLLSMTHEDNCMSEL